MKFRSLFGFLLQAVTVGLAAAIVLLLVQPDFGSGKAVVEVKQGESLVSTPGAIGQVELGMGPVSYANAVANTAPAVVNIHTAKVITRRSGTIFNNPLFRELFGDALGAPRRSLETSLGSGVIISSQGYILTNHHVIEDADEIQVMLQDERSAPAELVGTDPETDLAVLKVALDNLPTITIGDSTQLRVGDVVLAIGNPFGVGQTVTMGIVSAKGRNRLGINTFENFIQTDAAINPGNSGGALINPYGQLIGINTAIFSKSGGSQGIGFAIPVSLAQGIMTQIIEKGQVSRGWLGIEIQEITPALAESFNLEDIKGVLVAGVLRQGPADHAGMAPGDIITHVDDKVTADPQTVLETITGTASGKTIRIRVLRNGETKIITARITDRPQATRR